MRDNANDNRVVKRLREIESDTRINPVISGDIENTIFLNVLESFTKGELERAKADCNKLETDKNNRVLGTIQKLKHNDVLRSFNEISKRMETEELIDTLKEAPDNNVDFREITKEMLIRKANL